MYNSDFLPVRVGAKPHEELNDDVKNPNNYPGKAGYRTHKWHSGHKKSLETGLTQQMPMIILKQCGRPRRTSKKL